MQQKMSLSPVRLAQPRSHPLDLTGVISDEDQPLLAVSSHFCERPFCSNGPRRSSFESWPSADLQSTPTTATASPETEALAVVVPSRTPQVFPATEAEEDSVLAKYIERFRHGRPQSREERKYPLTVEDREIFWRLTSSSSQSQYEQQDDSSIHKYDEMLNLIVPAEKAQLSPPLPHRATQGSSCMCLSNPNYDAGCTEILQLQEMASRLLQRSEHTLSGGSIPICSEGLASDISSRESVQNPVAASFTDLTNEIVKPGSLALSIQCKPSVNCLSASCTPLEDDILFQWRLRRKMEQAKHESLLQPHGQVPQQHRGYQGATASPSLPISSPILKELPYNTTVQPHVHLLCDALPCPIEQLAVQRWNSRKPVHNPSQPQGDSTESSSETVPNKNVSSSSPVSSDTIEDEWTGQGAKAMSQKKVSQEVHTDKSMKFKVSSRRKKDTARHHTSAEEDRFYGHKRDTHLENGVASDNKRQEVLPSWPQQSTKQGSEVGAKETSRCKDHTGNQAPPPSPIHSTLGQVVSEVLFPVPDSPRVGTPGFIDSPKSTPPVPPQPPAAVINRSQPPEAIVLLLHEAEDSDGLEFEDDDLLQVLRQQREWVKEQIREIDAMLNELTKKMDFSMASRNDYSRH